MRTISIGVLFSIMVSAHAAPQSVPKVLIIQFDSVGTKPGDPNVPFANFVAQEMNDSGKLSAIVWSITDPNFRAAALNGKIRRVPDSPQIDDVLSGANDLGVSYVLACDAAKTGAQVTANARLLRNGNKVWNDTQMLAVTTNGAYDAIGSARSIARTLVLKMVNTAFKELPTQPKVDPPEVLRGQAPVITAVPVEVPKQDNNQLRTDSEGLLRVKQYSSAIEILRDAVDLSPFDPERRSLLIQALAQHEPAAAADEAHRASLVMPDKPEFRVMAARAWMQAGDSRKALDELNESIARAPDAGETRMLLAEVSLQGLEPERALAHIDQAIKSDPTVAEPMFYRALCRSMLGGTDGTRLDLQTFSKLSPKSSDEDVSRRYRLVISIYDRLMVRNSNDIRDLISHTIVRPREGEVQDSIEQFQKRISARIAMLEMIQIPPDEQKTHDRWLLAHKLLAQTIRDLKTFTGGDSDALTDTRMNFGESINQANQARNSG